MLFALRASFNTYEKDLYSKFAQELEFYTRKVNDKLDALETLSAETAMDDKVQGQLRKIRTLPNPSSNFDYEKFRLRSILQDKIIFEDDIKNIFFTDKDSIEMTIGTDTGAIPDEAFEKILNDFTRSRGGFAYLPPTQDYPYLLGGRDILERQNASLDYLGTLIFTVDVEKLLRSERTELKTPHCSLIVTDESTIIYRDENTPDVPAFSTEALVGTDVVTIDDMKYLRCYEQSEPTGWTYACYFPYEEIFGHTRAIAVFMILSVMLIFAVMLSVTLLLMRRDHNKQMLLLDTRNKMLQAQINPHFLNNTLSSVGFLIKADRKDDAYQMIIELGKLLRASFSKQQYVSVAEEVGIATSYMKIQQYRYSGRAEFTINASGELDRYKIPKMILQPLIENAVLYGIDDRVEFTSVTVTVTEETDDIVFAVADTGAGMSGQDLEAARKFTIRPKGTGIGLQNIKERLDLAFDGSSFEIDSIENKGTTVTIHIPKVTMECTG